MPTRDHRLAAFARVALCLEKQEDYPAAVMVAQWAVESAWGLKQSGQHNHFGIKFVEGQHDAFSWVSTKEHGDDDDLAYYRRLERVGRVRNVAVAGKTPGGKYIIQMDDRFADFDSPMDGARGYVHFLKNNPRYSQALAQYAVSRDPIQLIKDICRAGYATGEGYGKTVTTIANQSNVREALTTALAMGDPCVA